MSVPARRAMIGRGLAGAIIRNLLHDMFKVKEDRRSKLKAGRLRIKRSELEKLRA